jgi:hypothetical protein
MSHSVGSSDVGDYEEDPNIPTDVGCGKHQERSSSEQDQDDDVSISSELSDQSMKHDGLSYDCKPDISEVANMTHDINYGDFANMASRENKSNSQLMNDEILDPVFSMDDGDTKNLTWSQLLDNTEGRHQPDPIGIEHSSKSFIWTQGYDPTASLSGASLLFPEPFSAPYKMNRRPSSDSISLRSFSGLQRPRPLSALKRFLSGRTPKQIIVKGSSFNTADTTNSHRRVEAAVAG